MTQKRRYFSDPSKRASAKLTFRVNPLTRMVIESSTADQPAEFLRGVADRIAAKIESGMTPAEILASLDNWQTIGGSDDKDTP